MHLSMVWRGESGSDQSTEHIDEPQRQSAFKNRAHLLHTLPGFACVRSSQFIRDSWRLMKRCTKPDRMGKRSVLHDSWLTPALACCQRLPVAAAAAATAAVAAVAAGGIAA